MDGGGERWIRIYILYVAECGLSDSVLKYFRISNNIYKKAKCRTWKWFYMELYACSCTSSTSVFLLFQRKTNLSVQDFQKPCASTVLERGVGKTPSKHYMLF